MNSTLCPESKKKNRKSKKDLIPFLSWKDFRPRGENKSDRELRSDEFNGARAPAALGVPSVGAQNKGPSSAGEQGAGPQAFWEESNSVEFSSRCLRFSITDVLELDKS